MNEQAALFSEKLVPPVPGPLTDKQARALEIVKAAGTEGVTGAQLGFRYHGHATHPCDFCQTTGLSYLRALKKKHHVRQTKGGVFIAIDLPDPKAHLQGSFPEGF